MRSVLLAVVAACLLFAASQAKSQQRDCYSQFPGAAQRPYLEACLQEERYRELRDHARRQELPYHCDAVRSLPDSQFPREHGPAEVCDELRTGERAVIR
jgi:hypothetical protein